MEKHACPFTNKPYTSLVSSYGEEFKRSRSPAHYESPLVTRMARRVDRVFDSLDARHYLGDEERTEFRHYHRLFSDNFAGIDRKIKERRLKPIDLAGFPQILRYPGLTARVGVFIGSFDPFQMTHLAAALRFLSSEEGAADLVFVVPEGSQNPVKPKKTEYSFRFELLRLQLEGVFSPFIVPLDIGKDADTIGIVERLIDLHAGATLSLTHVLGSDSLPTAVRLLPEDLEAWRVRAAARGVQLDHGIFAIIRERGAFLDRAAEEIRNLGVRFATDSSPLGTPSSTDFREERRITIAFPTEAVLSRLELLFRYGMNRPWMRLEGDQEPEYRI